MGLLTEFWGFPWERFECKGLGGFGLAFLCFGSRDGSNGERNCGPVLTKLRRTT